MRSLLAAGVNSATRGHLPATLIPGAALESGFGLATGQPERCDQDKDDFPPSSSGTDARPELFPLWERDTDLDTLTYINSIEEFKGF